MQVVQNWSWLPNTLPTFFGTWTRQRSNCPLFFGYTALDVLDKRYPQVILSHPAKDEELSFCQGLINIFNFRYCSKSKQNECQGILKELDS